MEIQVLKRENSVCMEIYKISHFSLVCKNDSACLYQVQTQKTVLHNGDK